MSDGDSTRPSSSDSQRRIAGDLLCSGCEYNLRGLFDDALCPECGRPVARSLRGDLARTADPRWLTTLAEGSRPIFIGMLVASIVAVVVQAIGLVFFGQFFGLVRQTPQALGHPVVIAALAPSLWGFWMLTTPEPGISGRSQLDARRMARFCIPAAMVIWPAWIWPNRTLAGVQITADLMLLVGLLAIFIYARRLARRLPDVRLARYTHLCMWAVALAFLLSCLFRDPWKDFLLNTPKFSAVFRSNAAVSLARLFFRVSVELILSIIGMACLGMLLLLAWYRDRLRGAARSAAAR